jgi:hypothetical protein
MARAGNKPGPRLVRVSGATGGSAIMKRVGPRGVVTVPRERAPSELHLATSAGRAATGTKGHTTKAKKHTTKKHKGSSGHKSTGHHTLNDQDVVQIVLAALQGGPLRLAVEDIVLQVIWQVQSQQSSAMAQGGSYQRMGGF